MINEYTLRELNCKINTIIKFLKDYDGYSYELYNHTCPAFTDEPDSNIVEYAQDIKDILNSLNAELPF